MAAVTICSNFGAPKNKVWHCFHCLPSISHEVMGPDAMILLFWMLSFKPTFSVSSFTFIKRLFSSSSLSAIRVVSSAYLLLPYLKHFTAFHHSKVRNQNPLNGPQNFVWPGPCCVPHHLITLPLPAMTLLSMRHLISSHYHTSFFRLKDHSITTILWMILFCCRQKTLACVCVARLEVWEAS